jgi:hypothetical protein
MLRALVHTKKATLLDVSSFESFFQNSILLPEQIKSKGVLRRVPQSVTELASCPINLRKYGDTHKIFWPGGCLGLFIRYILLHPSAPTKDRFVQCRGKKN